MKVDKGEQSFRIFFDRLNKLMGWGYTRQITKICQNTIKCLWY